MVAHQQNNDMNSNKGNCSEYGIQGKDSCFAVCCLYIKCPTVVLLKYLELPVLGFFLKKLQYEKQYL